MTGPNLVSLAFVNMWGSKNDIGDITTAAGWEIIDCSPEALDQDIRIVCKEDSSVDCSRLFNSGAEGKIVRLPENCGRSAFAVVTDSWVSEDQSIPPNLAASLSRRDGSASQVKALRLTTKFDSVDVSKRKNRAVNFAIQAANFPGAAGNVQVDTSRPRRPSRIAQRGFSDFITNTLGSIASLNNFNVDKSTALDPISVNKTFNLIDQKVSCPPVDASLKIDVTTDAQANITIGIAASGIFVPPVIQEFAIITSMSAELNGSVDVAAGVTGTLDSGKINLLTVPIGGIDFPGILTIGPTFEVNAQAIAKLDVDLGLTVGVNYKVDNAQLVFPPNSNRPSGGSFNAGNTPLKLSASPNAKATGTLEAHLIPSLNLGLSALNDVAKASIFVELDGSASLTLGLEAAAEDIPILNVSSPAEKSKKGIMQIRGATQPGHYFWSPPLMPDEKVSSTIVDEKVPSTRTMMEGPSVVTVTVTEKAGHWTTPSATPTTWDQKHPAATTIILNGTPSGYSTSASATPGTIWGGNLPSPYSSSSRGLELETTSKLMKATATGTNTASAPASTATGGTEGSGSFSGCVEIGAGLDVNAGADANFFELFNTGTKVSLFSKKFELFKVSYDSSRYEARGVVATRDIVSDLLCPAADTTAAQTIVDQIIAAADIKAV
ncbi:hypothetical protein JR316_0011329 [Psilocybe cubensis]|uniref:Uncharacterized protein n=1 Tax=Psilocybe cubensis TaxID=181762 RepID=A0ACB8GJZ1_PSICU|nr:hypothetical protein JR316_0011329 [Psilocybe cubensis]KAH9475770.1 hypothetical protein JR316_0011329 [Psilocybe cubensis]